MMLLCNPTRLYQLGTSSTPCRFSRHTLPILLTVCLVFCTSINKCDSEIARKKLHRAKADPVPGCYFVHFKRGTNASACEDLLNELKQRDEDTARPNFQAFVQAVMTKTVHGFAIKMSSEALRHVLQHSSVNFVEEDSYIHPGQLRDIHTTSARVVGGWGIDRMDVKTNQYDGYYAPPCGLTGRNVDVYIVDSGLHYDHEQFGGRALFSGCDAIEQITNTSSQRRGRDCNGHGTQIAGIVGSNLFGVAPAANLLSVRVLNCQGAGSWNTILAGLECLFSRVRQHRNRTAVVNLSVTGASKNRAIKSAIDKLIDNGVVVVGISGNNRVAKSGNACKVAPGSIPGVITVAGTTRADEAFNKTLMGRCVDILAPAEDLVSTDYNCRDCIARRLDGSSFAAPHVTGAIALLLEKCPLLPPWKVRYYLLTKMSTFDAVRTSGIIPKKYQVTTPNLLVHTGPEMCSIAC